jgi:hypothetical protein
MIFRSKALLCLIAASGMLATSHADAFAWACQAQANDGASGYSYNYPNRRSARQRALAECNVNSSYQCYIIDCQRNG